MVIQSKQRGHSHGGSRVFAPWCSQELRRGKPSARRSGVLQATTFCFCLTQVRQLQGTGTSHCTELCSGFKMQMSQCSTSGREVREGPAVVGNTCVLENGSQSWSATLEWMAHSQKSKEQERGEGSRERRVLGIGLAFVCDLVWTSLLSESNTKLYSVLLPQLPGEWVSDFRIPRRSIKLPLPR